MLISNAARSAITACRPTRPHHVRSRLLTDPALGEAKGGPAGTAAENLAILARRHLNQHPSAATLGEQRAAPEARTAQNSPAGDLRSRRASRPFPGCVVPRCAAAPYRGFERTTTKLLEPLPPPFFNPRTAEGARRTSCMSPAGSRRGCWSGRDAVLNTGVDGRRNIPPYKRRVDGRRENPPYKTKVNFSFGKEDSVPRPVALPAEKHTL
jgi:hypothetical protein